MNSNSNKPLNLSMMQIVGIKIVFKAVFGCCKTFSGKYIFSGNANFWKRKIFPCVWLHFKKFSGKYFLVFGKEEGKHKSRKTQATTPKKTHQRRQGEIAPTPSIAIQDSDQRRDRDLTFFAIDGAISRRRDRDRRIFLSDLAIFLDGSSSRISRPTYDMSRSRIFLSHRRSRSRSGAISRRRDRDQRRNLTTARSRLTLLLSRARALSPSLIFRKCFEGKIEV